MPPCEHGLQPSKCLICATLRTDTSDPPKSVAIPTGPAQVLRRDDRHPRADRRPRLAPRLLGGLLAIVVIALLGWWILGLVWAVLRLVELIAVGLGCGYLGYRVGVATGRHQAKHPS